MIVNDNSSIISKWSIKLIDDPRVVIYDRHRFVIQATELRWSPVVPKIDKGGNIKHASLLFSSVRYVITLLVEQIHGDKKLTSTSAT